MIARELVLQRWPDAVCEEYFDGAKSIWTSSEDYIGQLLGSGPTEEAAWRDAARNLEEGK